MSLAAGDDLLPVIRAALDQTRSAACITSADLDEPGPQIVYVNPAYCQMMGCRVEDVVGRNPRIMQGPLTDRAQLDRLRASLEAGQPFEGEAVNYRMDGRPFLNSWRIDPVADATGSVTHYIATQQDITFLRRSERLLAAEQAIDRSVAYRLQHAGDSESNIQHLVAEIGAALEEMVDGGQVAVTGLIRLGTEVVEFQHGPPVDVESLSAALTESGGSAIGSADGERWWVASSLTVEQRGLEGLVVITGLTSAELAFIDRVGLDRAVESARRAIDSLAEFERQRLVAIELQRDLLPTEPNASPLRLSARYQPAAFATRVGGDWYDVVEIDQRVVVVVGDMAGSGVRAAADMGRVRLLTRALLQQGLDIGEVFAALNRFCDDEDLIATVLAVSINPADGEAVAVSAGHLPPVVRRKLGTELLSLKPAPLLGFGGSLDYPEQPFSIEPGDVIVMLTDGLIERPDELIDDSLDRLVRLVDRGSADVDEVAGELIANRPSADRDDDIALVAFSLR